MWASSGARPVADQYASRFWRPVRCGRKPGTLDEGADPAEHARAGRDGLAEHVDAAGVGGDEAHDHAHRRRLAGTVGAEQPDDLALLGAPRHVVDGAVPVGVRLDESLDDERDVGEVGTRRQVQASATADEPADERGEEEQHERRHGEDRLGVDAPGDGPVDRGTGRDRQRQRRRRRRSGWRSGCASWSRSTRCSSAARATACRRPCRRCAAGSEIVTGVGRPGVTVSRSGATSGLVSVTEPPVTRHTDAKSVTSGAVGRDGECASSASRRRWRPRPAAGCRAPSTDPAAPRSGRSRG